MASLRGRTVKVAGAGALGLSIAVELAEAGAAVTVFDPSPETSASLAAAGMLAPVYEAVLDPVARDHFPLLLAARDAWPAFAERTRITLDRSGAIYAGERTLGVRKAVADLGVAGEVRREGLFVADDWRLDPEVALKRLCEAAARRGVVLASTALEDPEGVEAIAATGWRAVNWAPESAVVSAIKGQLLVMVDGPLAERTEGPVERRDGGYIVPHAEGVVIGATMQPGRTDIEADDAIVDL
ncbi:MAG TPA: FAD-dependent oxidoreductase, partial [Caulobacter sp.]|nr:FAD-dependent oxidoreductase [Caulobacter sp.]